MVRFAFENARPMSVVGTLRLRCDDPAAKLSGVFDALARDRSADVARLLWGDAKP